MFDQRRRIEVLGVERQRLNGRAADRETVGSRSSTTPLLSADANAAVGVGLGTIDHAVPFQCSTSVLTEKSVSKSVAESPTTRQSVALEHDTPFNSASG